MLFAGLFLTGCVRAIGPIPAAADREQGRERLERFADAWLQPAKVAPPTVSFDAQLAEADGLTARARLVQAETQEWNRWPDGLRLFNNRGGYFFEVEIAGDGKVAWVPGDTQLERNDPGEPLWASGEPDVFLFPLQQAAIHSSMLVVDTDFPERARAAGPFRSAYLSARGGKDHISGLIGFQTEDAHRHVVAMRLTLAVYTDEGLQKLVFDWD
ncbi:MAG: hypothetical protein KC912_09185 [Proteobacteria bacterium]|nr:hypothetical protein [Pseudomonadota bacterium]